MSAEVQLPMSKPILIDILKKHGAVNADVPRLLLLQEAMVNASFPCSDRDVRIAAAALAEFLTEIALTNVQIMGKVH